MISFQESRKYLTGGLVGAWFGKAASIITMENWQDIQQNAFGMAALTALVMIDILPRITKNNPKVPAEATSILIGAVLGFLSSQDIDMGTHNTPSPFRSKGSIVMNEGSTNEYSLRIFL